MRVCIQFPAATVKFYKLSVTSLSSGQRRSRLWLSYFSAPQIDNPQHRRELVNLIPDHRFPVRLSSRIIDSHTPFHIASVAANHNTGSLLAPLSCRTSHHAESICLLRSLVPYTTPSSQIPRVFCKHCVRVFGFLRRTENHRLAAPFHTKSIQTRGNVTVTATLPSNPPSETPDANPPNTELSNCSSLSTLSLNPRTSFPTT